MAIAYSTPWLLRINAQHRPVFRIVFLPNAGGGASTFRQWVDLFDEDIEICLLRPPGRENRMQDPACTTMRELVANTVDALTPLLDSPLALFGHSMGALTAFETAIEIRGRFGIEPIWLGVAANRPPQHKRQADKLLSLPDAELITVLNARYGGIPHEVVTEPQVLALFAPAIRADIALIENYKFQPDRPLGCPIHAFGGYRDAEASYDQLLSWQEMTTAKTQVQMFPGGHFFLHDHRTEIAAIISDSVSKHRITSTFPHGRPDVGGHRWRGM